jgi:hypothetical protein
LTNNQGRVNEGNRISAMHDSVTSRPVAQWGLYRRCIIVNMPPARVQSSQHTMERLSFEHRALFAPETGSGGQHLELGPTGFWVTDLKEINPLDFSEDGHWLYRQLVLLGDGLETDMLQVLGQGSGHNLQAAIEELKRVEFVDDTKPGVLRLTAMKWIPYGKWE